MRFETSSIEAVELAAGDRPGELLRLFQRADLRDRNQAVRHLRGDHGRGDQFVVQIDGHRLVDVRTGHFGENLRPLVVQFERNGGLVAVLQTPGHGVFDVFARHNRLAVQAERQLARTRQRRDRRVHVVLCRKLNADLVGRDLPDRRVFVIIRCKTRAHFLHRVAHGSLFVAAVRRRNAVDKLHAAADIEPLLHQGQNGFHAIDADAEPGQCNRRDERNDHDDRRVLCGAVFPHVQECLLARNGRIGQKAPSFI